MRRIATPNEFFDILDRMGDNKFVTIGYVTSANLNVPKVKRINPLTNRMKGYDDYSSFGDEEIGALVKISSYNMRYRRRDVIAKQYGEYKDSANRIKREYGLDPIKDKENSYKDRINYGEQGVDLYKGSNDNLQGHSYYSQNVYGIKPKSVVYCVGTDGHIIKALSQEQVIPYLKEKRQVDGVSALKKMGVEEERIQEYISKIQALKMNYKNFEANSILWIAATINGEKIVYINDNLCRTVNDVDINPQDFVAIAKKRYEKDLLTLQEMTNRMKNNVIRVNEKMFSKIINESVNKILSELDWRTYATAGEKASNLSDNPNISTYEKQRRANQAASFNKYSNKVCDTQYGIDKIKDRALKHKIDKSNGRTSDDFAYTNGELKRLDRQSNDAYNFFQGNQEYHNGKWGNKNESLGKVNESFNNNDNYSHFAVNKATNKIVNGWNYDGYDSDDLRRFKHDYFVVDLVDYGLNPKQYKIVTKRFLLRQGINPDDNNNWSNE